MNATLNKLDKTLKLKNKKKFVLGKLNKKVYYFLVVIIVVSLLYLGKSLFVVALVNNQPISRLSLIKEMEKAGGDQLLQQKIDEVLILQEGKKQQVVIGDAEIEAKIKEIEESLSQQGQNLTDILKLQGINQEELVKQIRTQLTIEKLLSDRVTVTSVEIEESFEQNRDFYPEEATFEEVKGEVEANMIQQKLAQEYQTWLEELRAQAKIRYFVNY